MGIDGQFVRRAGAVLAMIAALALVGAGVVLAADLFPLLFGAVLFSLFLRGLSDALVKRTRIGSRSALGLVLLLLLLLGGLAGWFMVPSLVEQARQFARELPRYVEQTEALIAEYLGGEGVLEQARSAAESADFWGGVSAALAVSYGGLFAILVIVISGLYLAYDPQPYVRGVIRLLPPGARARGRDVLSSMGLALQKFLLGRVVSMVAVGTITGVVLAVVGVPLAALLGLIAGLLTFVPYAGPIVATLPIALVAATEGSKELLFAVSAYAGVQMLEGFLITPLVQERAVDLPPVLTLAAEIFMGMVFGVMGVVISVPLAAVGIVFVRMVYVESVIERGPAGPASAPG